MYVLWKKPASNICPINIQISRFPGTSVSPQKLDKWSHQVHIVQWPSGLAVRPARSSCRMTSNFSAGFSASGDPTAKYHQKLLAHELPSKKLHQHRPQIEKVGTDGSQRGNQRLPWQGTAGSQTLKLTVPNLGTRGYHCKELPVPRSLNLCFRS